MLSLTGKLFTVHGIYSHKPSHLQIMWWNHLHRNRLTMTNQSDDQFYSGELVSFSKAIHDKSLANFVPCSFGFVLVIRRMPTSAFQIFIDLMYLSWAPLLNFPDRTRVKLVLYLTYTYKHIIIEKICDYLKLTSRFSVACLFIIGLFLIEGHLLGFGYRHFGYSFSLKIVDYLNLGRPSQFRYVLI